MDAEAFGAAALRRIQSPASLPLHRADEAGSVRPRREHLGVAAPGVDLLSTAPRQSTGLLNAEAGRQRPPVRRRIGRADWHRAPDVLDLLEGPSLSVLEPVF